jgi:hypothetical protein
VLAVLVCGGGVGGAAACAGPETGPGPAAEATCAVARHPPRAGPGWHDSWWPVDLPGSCSSTVAPRRATRCRWRRPGEGDQLRWRA